MKKKEYPVFLIKGFLDSGKTKFVRDAVIGDGFAQRGDTLVFLLEEGEEEFDEQLLKDNYTSVYRFESQDDFTIENIEKVVNEIKPDRILIEMNSMWDINEIKFPKSFVIVQSITFIDASTFKIYFNNMRQKFVDMLKDSDAIFFNRIENIEEMATYQQSLKMINPNAEYVYQKVNGEIVTKLECDLPYDIKSDLIKFEDNDFGVWYIDAIDNPDRYEGKYVEFNGQIMNDSSFPKGVIVVGREAMTCCADDNQFIGPYVVAKGVELPDYTWVRIKSKINYEEDRDGRKVIILTCEELTKINPIKDPVLNLV